MHLCNEIEDCNGVTKVNNDYELRSGKVFLPSDMAEESWRIFSEKAARKPVCVISKNSVINEAKFLAKYPAAKQSRKCGPNGVFRFENIYIHLNDLFKFGI